MKTLVIHDDTIFLFDTDKPLKNRAVYDYVWYRSDAGIRTTSFKYSWIDYFKDATVLLVDCNTMDDVMELFPEYFI